MSGVSQVTLLGNLTRKPEVRYLQSGTAVVKFGVAVNRNYKGQDGEKREEVTFVDVTFFGKRGEAFAKYHDKGALALLFGSLRLDQWDDKQTGEKRSKLYVVADAFEFVGGKREGGGPSREEGGEHSGYGGGYGASSAPVEVDDTPF